VKITKTDAKIVERVLDLIVEIQQIAAPTFEEAQRAKFLFERLKKEGLKDVSQDKLGNVFARHPGASSDHPLIVSAHIDTVFPLNTDLSIRRTSNRIKGAGVGDNATGVAALFGLLWSLEDAKVRLPHDLWLVANVGEEALGNLVGMQAVVKRFGGQPLAYIVLEGMAYGRVYHRGLGVRRFQINAKSRGGHSWVDHGTPSAIHELASLVTQLTALPLKSHPRTILNVGRIEGGVSVNTIAPEARLELDLRSTDPSALNELTSQVEALVRAGNRANVRFDMKSLGERPVGELQRDHPLVQLAADILTEQGMQPDLNIGSTDANIPLSNGYPAICIGLTTGGGAHTQDEYIKIDPLKQGLEHLMALVQRVAAG